MIPAFIVISCYNNDKTNLDNNIWIKYFSKARNARGWAGFEAEISKIIQCLDASHKNIKYHDKEKQKLITIDYNKHPYMRILFDRQLSDNSSLYNEDGYVQLIERLLKDLEKMIVAFEIYLAFLVEKNEVKHRIPDSDIDMESVNYVLSFNYTNTFERLYIKCMLNKSKTLFKS